MEKKDGRKVKKKKKPDSSLPRPSLNFGRRGEEEAGETQREREREQ